MKAIFSVISYALVMVLSVGAHATGLEIRSTHQDERSFIRVVDIGNDRVNVLRCAIDKSGCTQGLNYQISRTQFLHAIHEFQKLQSSPCKLSKFACVSGTLLGSSMGFAALAPYLTPVVGQWAFFATLVGVGGTCFFIVDSSVGACHDSLSQTGAYTDEVLEFLRKSTAPQARP